jgi:hypothetical protein
MQLSNPARERRRAAIVDSLSSADRAKLAGHIVRFERALDRRHRQDADLADALLRVLKSPIGKALRDRIKELATNG